MTAGLTKQQIALLAIIKEFIDRTGYSPSYDEMGRAMGLQGRGGVHRLVHGLQDRGFIALGHYRRRSITLVDRRTYRDGVEDACKYVEKAGYLHLAEDIRVFVKQGGIYGTPSQSKS